MLREQGKSKRHLDKGPLQNLRVCPLPFKPVSVVSTEVKKLEIKLSIMSVCQTSFNSMDHVSEILSEKGKGSTFEKIKLHRTKEILVKILTS
jgi:hypothetical protein